MAAGAQFGDDGGTNRGTVYILFLSALDDEGPVTTNVVAMPKPVAVNTAITLTATVNDTDAGACHFGACIEDTTGKAHFGFVSKYKQGANVPTGQTQFQFQAGSLNFHSASYEWLVVANARAQYKGVGTINGSGNYGFMLTAIDAELTSSTNGDLFRIKIWNKDAGDTIVYDNQVECGGGGDTADPCTAIGGGNIKIHAN